MIYVLCTRCLLMPEALPSVHMCGRSGVKGPDALAWAQLEGEKLRSWLSYLRRLRRRSPGARRKHKPCSTARTSVNPLCEMSVAKACCVISHADVHFAWQGMRRCAS